MGKFKIGDKVVLKKGLVVGQCIDCCVFRKKMIFEGARKITAVRKPIFGENDRYTLEGFESWSFIDPFLDPAEVNKIVITTDGKETLARLYCNNEVIKKATAKCSPADTFDFGIGAKIAFDRLMGEKPEEKKEPESPYFTGKAVVVGIEWDNTFSHDMTVGKVYDIKDGVYTDDKGWHSVSGGVVKKDRMEYKGIRFLAIKE